MFDKDERSTFKQIVNDLETIYFDVQNLAKYSSIFKFHIFKSLKLFINFWI